MKMKSLIGAGLVLTSLLASCSNEDMLQGGSQNGNATTLTAYIDNGSDSRVEIDSKGLFSWSDGDKISVQSSDNEFGTWSTSSDQITDRTVAEFTAEGSATAVEEAVAVYPANLNPSLSGETLTVTLPDTYTYGTSKPVLTGTYKEGEVNFAHAGGLVRVSYTNVPTYANKFVFKASSQIAGEFTIEDGVLKPVSTEDNNEVSISFTSTDLTDDGSITFDIPVPAGVYENFTASLYYGEVELNTKSASVSNTVNVRDLLVMPTIAVTDYFANKSYIVEKVKPSSTSSGTYIIYNTGNVASIYIDGVQQSNIVSKYTFADKNEHTIVFVMGDNFTSANGLFEWCSNVTSLDLSHFDTSKVTDMNHMFYACTSLLEVDFSNVNTSLVTDMENMFDTCTKLNSLDLSSFDTSNVTKMSWMFLNCQALTSVNVLSFNTSKVTNMIAMFSLCSSLTSLDLSSFDTSNVESMMQMFIHCYGLAELKMKGGLKSGVDVENMFTNAGSKAATTPIFYYKNGDELNYSAVIGTLGDDNTYSGGALPSSWTRQVISE